MSANRQRLRTGLTIVIALSFFAVAGWNLEIDDQFEAARTALGPNHRGIGMIETLAELIVASDLEGDALDAFPGAAGELVSTRIVGSADQRPDWPLLSLVVAPHDLHDPVNGIMANPLQRGRAWERTGQVTYFEEGQPVLASRAGVRVHGGDERRALGTTPMFRLYFRDRYRPDHLRPSTLLGPDGEPESRWVVRHPPHTNFFANAFAFEIARRNGALTPGFRPVRFFLNGDYMGNYLLIEQIARSGWGESFFDHDDYLLYIYRDAGDPHEESATAYRELERWANDPASVMTLEEAARRIDVENYALHLLTFAFSGERDPYQGAVFRDQRTPGSRWTWVHYDLDQSFTRDSTLPPEIDWRKPGFRLFTDYLTGERGTDIRAVLFRRLIEDPAFRDYFTDIVLDRLNHSIDQAFLQDLVDRYAYTGEPPGNFSGIDIGEFFRRRPAWLVRDLQDVAGVAIDEVTMRSGRAGMIRVEGHPVAVDYRGWYRRGAALELVIDNTASDFSHWMVDGDDLGGERRLTVAVDGPAEIVAVSR